MTLQSSLPDQGDLIRAGAMFSQAQNFKALSVILVEQSLDISRSDLAALYLFLNHEDPKSGLKPAYKRGRDMPPDKRIRKYTHWALERLDSLGME